MGSQVATQHDARTDFVTIREAALELKTSRHRVLALCALSGVRPVEVGRAYLLRREDLELLRPAILEPQAT
jgi:hypothetical protein